MNRRKILRSLLTAMSATALPPLARSAEQTPNGSEPMASGPFAPDWQSLSKYKTPDWFRNAKFGIWAHWGPQCEPEFGDWYARAMYEEGSPAYRHHLDKYGHPSKVGFKDVIRRWKAEKWNPDELVGLYKRAGARYFMALANHHDNFDLYDSKYQKSWNSTKMGPRKDLIGGWEKAARKHGLPFGVSVHAAHAWTWFETAQRADKKGPLAGVPYDGKLRKSDGKGTWWEGLDPQELYAQNHPLSERSEDVDAIHSQWNWGNGAAPVSKAFAENFYNRTIDLINKYNPEMVYFDDTALPLWPVSDVGLRIAAHMYNRSLAKNGKVEAVINGKILDELQRQCLVWDVERGHSNRIEPFPWQTCTCIGSWHYDRRIYDKKTYKSAATVIRTLIDVVSKNGNLLLSVPVRGNGSIDEQERAVVEQIGQWMAVQSEGIYDTQPWAVYGEGPVMSDVAPMKAQGFNEGKSAPYSAEDIRFTAKGDSIYAFVMAWPGSRTVLIKSLKRDGPHTKRAIARISSPGVADALAFTQTDEGLLVKLPASMPATPNPFALRIVQA